MERPGGFEILDAVQMLGRDNHLIWQKERLLKVLIERSDADKVAWGNSDLIFENDNWYRAAIALLDEFPAVQPNLEVEQRQEMSHIQQPAASV